MAVGTVTARAVPAPYDEDFVNGEQALHVSATLNSTPNGSIFRLQKAFDFVGGNYTLKCFADDAASWWVLTEEGGGRALFGHVAGQGVVEASIFIPPGRQRVEIILVNNPAVSDPEFVGPPGANSDCYVAFSLWQNGQMVYASAAPGWIFDTEPIDAEDVPPLGDARLALPLFRVTPDWTYGVIERLSYRTEILSDENDDEQTRSLRRFPRRSVEATFSRYDVRRASLESFVNGVGSGLCLVPLWFDQEPLSGPLGAEYTFAQSTLAMREFLAGDLVLVSNKNLNDYEVLTIAAVSLPEDKIEFEDAPSRSWSIGSRITPLRVARVLDAPSFNNPTSRVGVGSIRFELDEPCRWPDPSWGYCVPVWRRRVDWSTPISKQFQRLTYILDNETGRVDVQDTSSQTRVGMRVALKMFGREDVFAFRQFIGQARGRALRFWMPSLVSDIPLAGDIAAGDYIDAKPAGIAEYLSTRSHARSMLAVVTRDGSIIYRKVLGSAVIGEWPDNIERIYLARAIAAVPAALVERVMFVMPARFDQDAFELRHLVDASAAVTTTVAVRSSNPVGLPEIECDETSLPYPVVAEDAIDVGMSIVSAGFKTFVFPPELMDVDAAILSGSVIEVLKTYTVLPDEMNTAMSVVSGSFTEFTFLNYESPTAEQMNVSAIVLNGTLINGLIVTTMEPEGVNVSAQILEGTLS